MPRGNPNPVQTEALKAKQFKRHDASTEPLSSQLTCVRLTKTVHEAIQFLPSKSAWLRRVITEAAQRELMGKKGGDE
jgi:hypothetical protein